MATLNWIGKEKVINHHLDVPFKTLKHIYTYKDGNKITDGTRSENKIIHGDNLLALKSLLPEYEGKIKCIYIDPPYNTGNESWVYNDNVNHPKIKKWLGEVVGKEGEDLSRHDKWLCMMYPRLKLLSKLLSDDGLFFMSLDDNELENGLFLANTIFGSNNRLACAPWLAEPSGGKEKTSLRNGHEYVLIYHKGPLQSLTKEERDRGTLKLEDKQGKYIKGRELRKWGGTSLREDRPGQWFPLTTPTGEVVLPYRNDGKEGHWRWGKNQKMKTIIENPDNAHWELCKYDKGVTVNDQTERWVPFEKIRSSLNLVGWATWLDKVGFNSDGTKVLKEIFGEKPFDTPKPVSLIEWLLKLHSDKNMTVIDSFAGSGTTAHAVLNLNKLDYGSRKYILIEMEDYADSLTAERVKRVIDGYKNGNSMVERVGGSFEFLQLGETLFNPDGYINENQPIEDIRNYVYYSETRTSTGHSDNPRNKYYLGKRSNTAYYFYYEKEKVTTLDLKFVAKIEIKADVFIVYADKCALSERYLNEHNIVFKKIPRDITRI